MFLLPVRYQIQPDLVQIVSILELSELERHIRNRIEGFVFDPFIFDPPLRFRSKIGDSGN